MVHAKSTIKLSPSEYVSHVVALPTKLVAALTDSSIVSVPISDMSASAVSTVSKPNTGATMAGMMALPSTPMALTSCDANGCLKIWDLRAKNGLQQSIDTLDSNLTVTALGVSNFGEIALGTEASPDAEIAVYDVRQIKSAKPLVKYTDSHNDDVTDLQFHPTMRNLMVSGSTDGIVNLFDISIKDEDDAVLEAYNHQASIHRTGFFTDSHEAIRRLKIDDQQPSEDKIFALSHMETLTIYPVNLEKAKQTDAEIDLDKVGDANEELGDLREVWKCQYVADYQKQHFLIGSNDEQWASLVPILDGKPQPAVQLEGGHAEEVVRCFDLWQAAGACFTGGEDGTVKLWDITGQFDEAAQLNKELNINEGNETSGKPHNKRVLKRNDPIHRKNAKKLK